MCSSDLMLRMVEGGAAGALVFLATRLGVDPWRIGERRRFLLWFRPEAASMSCQVLGDGSPTMCVQRWHIPAAASDEYCGTSTQCFCYRAPGGFGYAVTSCSSSLAALRRRRWSTASSGAVDGRKDQQGLRFYFLFFKVLFAFFLDRCSTGWSQSVAVCVLLYVLPFVLCFI